MAQRYLIISADDLGADEARNAGIFAAVDAGVVTAVSLLPNGPALEDAVRGLRARRGRPLSVGLHLNVAEGKPVSPGLRRLVTTDGHFFGKPAVFGLLAESGAELAAEIATELTAQALRLQALGVAVDHLDGHRHGHIFPAVLPHALALAQRWGIPWFRLPEEEPPASPVDIPEDLRREAALFQRLAAAARPVVTAFARRGGCKGLRITDAFRGLYLRGCLAEGSLGEIIAGLPEGVTELMVHPGFRTSEKREGPFTAFSSPERERELAALLSPSFRAALTEGGVQLVPFPP